jgi:hypothetical protein
MRRHTQSQVKYRMAQLQSVETELLVLVSPIVAHALGMEEWGSG